MSPEIVSTSIAQTLIPRMSRTHQRRRISIFSGPPGIGKSTAIEAFRADHEGQVGVIAVPPGPKGGVRSVLAAQLALAAIREMVGWRNAGSFPASCGELRYLLFAELCEWAGVNRRLAAEADAAPYMTLIFDEAQNLSRDAIELLRFLNDAKGGYSPFPVGFVFVGNNEFLLTADVNGRSVLSAAVADRALYQETFTYSHVTDDDLVLFLEARGLVDPAALRLSVAYFGEGRQDRSFRRVSDYLDELEEEAAGAPITADVVKTVLGLI